MCQVILTLNLVLESLVDCSVFHFCVVGGWSVCAFLLSRFMLSVALQGVTKLRFHSGDASYDGDTWQGGSDR